MTTFATSPDATRAEVLLAIANANESAKRLRGTAYYASVHERINDRLTELEELGLVEA